jgi:Flp pilus assembly protein TadB
MAKLDRLKEELSYIRYYISIAITVALAVSGWLVMNIETATWYSIIGGSVVVIFNVFFVYTRHIRVEQLLQELEDA